MPQPWHYEDDTVRIRKICVGPLENNAYVVACARTGNAVLIDAAAEPDRLEAALAGLTAIAVLTTHGHWDHVQAARDVADRLSIPFRLHDADAEQFGLEPDEPVVPGPIPVGDLVIQALHTPGHTPGSVCYSLPGIVFSGDSLFPGGPGATAGPEEFGEVLESITAKLFTLPDTTLVMPGHGLDTTIGTERPSLPEWRARGW